MPPAITHYRIALIRRRVYLGLKEMINIVFFVYSIKLLFFFSFKSTLVFGRGGITSPYIRGNETVTSPYQFCVQCAPAAPFLFFHKPQGQS